MLKALAICATISIAASSCAAVRAQPASQPASMSASGYELVSEGEPARADGLFLTIPSAREMLKAQRLRELDLQEQLAESNLQRDAADKQLALDQFCAKWCLPLGLIGGTILGGAFGIWAGSKK
jgi:hypothetical protein